MKPSSRVRPSGPRLRWSRGSAEHRAIAGTASRPGHFVAGMHTAALITAGLFLAAAVAFLRSPPPRAGRG
jgi:hypothetical protein